MHFETKRDILNAHIKIIFDLLIPYSTKLSVMDGSDFFYTDEQNISFVYLVKSGHFLVKDLSAGMSIKTVSAPYIFGMAQVLYPEQMGLLAIEHISDGVIYRLESQRAIEIISKKQCWSSLAHFLAFQVGFLSSRYYDISHRSSYLVIKSLLLEMNNEPDEIIQNYSIEKYISERCYLGRSGIMKILSDLRKGGYVEIKRGKLIKINKLPEKY